MKLIAISTLCFSVLANAMVYQPGQDVANPANSVENDPTPYNPDEPTNELPPADENDNEAEIRRIVNQEFLKLFRSVLSNLRTDSDQVIVGSEEDAPGGIYGENKTTRKKDENKTKGTDTKKTKTGTITSQYRTTAASASPTPTKTKGGKAKGIYDAPGAIKAENSTTTVARTRKASKGADKTKSSKGAITPAPKDRKRKLTPYGDYVYQTASISVNATTTTAK